MRTLILTLAMVVVVGPAPARADEQELARAHFIAPQSDCSPMRWSTRSENGPIAESGNQSRSGSVTPI